MYFRLFCDFDRWDFQLIKINVTDSGDVVYTNRTVSIYPENSIGSLVMEIRKKYLPMNQTLIY